LLSSYTSADKYMWIIYLIICWWPCMHVYDGFAAESYCQLIIWFFISSVAALMSYQILDLLIFIFPCTSHLIIIMMFHDSFKMECITWSLLLPETHNLLPHKPLEDIIVKAHLHMSIITQWTASFKHMSSRDAYLGLSLLNLDDDHHLMSSCHGLYEILLLMLAHGKIPN
jgi:hypothetical protein